MVLRASTGGLFSVPFLGKLGGSAVALVRGGLYRLPVNPAKGTGGKKGRSVPSLHIGNGERSPISLHRSVPGRSGNGTVETLKYVAQKHPISPRIFCSGSVKEDAKDAEREPRIFPVLINVGTSQISGTPLSQYQAATLEKEELLLTVEALNDLLEKRRPGLELRGAFENNWDELQAAIAKIREIGLPPKIASLISGLQQLKRRFEKEWNAAFTSATSEPSSHLIEELRRRLQELKMEADTREQNYCKELDNVVCHVKQTSHKHRDTPAKNIPGQFDKLISQILAAYE